MDATYHRSQTDANRQCGAPDEGRGETRSPRPIRAGVPGAVYSSHSMRGGTAGSANTPLPRNDHAFMFARAL